MALKKETLHTCVCVIFFTYLGVFVRLALSLLADSVGSSFLPNLGNIFFLPNIFGSFIMGVVSIMIDHFRDRMYWHTGIASGFCGSCTTFASWHKTAVDFLISGYVADSLLISFFSFCTSYTALLFGRHVGDVLSTSVKMIKKTRNVGQTSTPETNKNFQAGELEKSKRESSHLDIYSILGIDIVLTIGLWAGTFLDPSLARRQWCIAMAFGPFGSLTRYGLSLYNKNFPNFPLYTFLVNVSASIISMLLLVIWYFLKPADPSKPDRLFASYELWALYGVSMGLLGCLSTVSTFVSEIYKFCAADQLRLAYRYGFISIVLTYVLCAIVGCVKYIK